MWCNWSLEFKSQTTCTYQSRFCRTSFSGGLHSRNLSIWPPASLCWPRGLAFWCPDGAPTGNSTRRRRQSPATWNGVPTPHWRGLHTAAKSCACPCSVRAALRPWWTGQDGPASPEPLLCGDTWGLDWPGVSGPPQEELVWDDQARRMTVFIIFRYQSDFSNKDLAQ